MKRKDKDVEALWAEVKRLHYVLSEAVRACRDLDDEALAREGRLACGAECAAAIEDLVTEAEPLRAGVECEYEVWQDGCLQAGGKEADYDSAQSEAGHYAAMYTPDGPVEVRIYEKRLISANKVEAERRRYDPYGSLSEYGIFPECDAVPATKAPRACTCHPDDRPDGPCRERYVASECQALAAPQQPVAPSVDEAVVEAVARAICGACEENPDRKGDARGNEFRWQDYRDVALAAISAFAAAQQPADDDGVVFIDGVGAARSDVKSCHNGVQWIRVGDRVYWPLSDSDAKRLHSACCGNGSFDGPTTPLSKENADAMLRAREATN